VNTIRMHVETTDDPAALDWVVRDGLVTGTAIFDGSGCPGMESLPDSLARLITHGVLARVAVNDGRIRVWRAHEEQWFDLAPVVQQAIMDSLSGGTRIVMTPVGACSGCPGVVRAVLRSRRNGCPRFG